MNLELNINNLNCAHCGHKIETAIAKLPDVEKCYLNFYIKKITLTVDKNVNIKDLLKEINLIANKIEYGVSFTSNNSEETNCNYPEECKCSDTHNKGSNFKNYSYDKHKINNLILVIATISLVLSLFFPFSVYKKLILIIIYFLVGYDILWKSILNLKNKNFLDENFLMSLATIGAISIGEYTEAIGVMIFYKIGEYFQEKAVGNSKKSIESLLKLKNITANLKDISGETKKVRPEALKKDDIIIVKVGESIPVDGIIIKGSSSLNSAALTGESLPISVQIGTEVLSGNINLEEILEIKVLREYKNSAISKIIKMVEESNSKKSEIDKFITKFAKYYTPIVVSSAVFIALIIPLFLGDFQLWFKKALIFLVISCPCALVLSVPLTFFSSIGLCSKRGILVKGANYLERLNKIDSIIFDKTGTLTKGTFKIDEIIHINSSKNEVLEIAKAGEIYSNHPLAKSILNYNTFKINENNINNYKEISGKGISCTYKNDSILVGNKKLMDTFNINYNHINLLENNSNVFIAKNNNLIGIIKFSDEIKEDATKTINFLKDIDISSYLLTGDNKNIGEKVGSKIGFKKENIFTNLLPENKVSILTKIKDKSKGTIFVGDGINDAPSLNLADIGIAMGGIGSDIAVESADIVLINDEPSKIIELLKIVKINKKIVIQNITFSLGVKFIVMLLGIMGLANIWMAIFADVGVSLIAVLNASRILKIKKL
ncbi:MAG: heavy metal translocating P-type ATPase [Fusobacterium sp. JB021]|nr:heavy metal translocating P-type ATPase [Fusobacterium sp. JB021]MDP0506349.1 heavy metal translocating P-type ATPase [Fusobacterium sp. JB019]